MVAPSCWNLAGFWELLGPKASMVQMDSRDLLLRLQVPCCVGVGALEQRTGGSEVAICLLNLVHISPHSPIYSVGLVFLVTGVTHQNPLWRGATFWDIGLLQTLRIGVYSDPRV